MADFNIIDYLSGLTLYTFDKAHLNAVALKCGVSGVTAFWELTEKQRDSCEIELLKMVVYGPYSTSSVKDKHGNFEREIGGYTLTETQLSQAKARLRRLLNKWDLEDDLEELDSASGTLKWIHEFD